MIEIIQNIIDLLTYTPTLYVDGMVGEVQGAWIGAAFGVIASLAGAGMAANGASSNAKQLKKAAKKNYNMLMENAEMSKMTLNEQMDLYKEDMDAYRSSMIQRYGLAGGIDPNTAQLEEVRNYQFGTKQIDLETYENKLGEISQQKIDKETKKADRRALARYAFGGSKDDWDDAENIQQRNEEVERAKEKYGKDWIDPQVTAYLGDQLRSYTGKQTPWDEQGSFFKSSRKGTGPAESSAILNLRTSVSNMQRDINNAYKAGMIDYWQQRKNAQNVKDTLQTQAIGYSTQAQTTIANGFVNAIQYGAQAYTQYKSGR